MFLKGFDGSKRSFRAIKQEMVIRIGFISLGPNLIALLAPSCAPINAPIAIENAMGSIIEPFSAKIVSDPILHEAFANFVYDMAFVIPCPRRITNEAMKKEPTPGPKIPS